MARPENKYTKLTPEQQEFAEANHNLIYHYLHKRNLPIDEYYDLVAISYVKAVKAYFMKEELRKYSFSTIFDKAAHGRLGNDFRSHKRKGRVPSSALFSLDIPEIRSALEYDSIQAQGNLWDSVEYQDLLNEICQYVTDRQRRILQMLLADYANTEIQKMIGISPATLWIDRQRLRKRIIESGILKPKYSGSKERS